MTKKIFWDKGHGGTDPGAVGNILLEKTLTHKIVEYGMAYLEANYTGHQQKTSRTGDQTLSLAQRTNDANAWGADLLISCHINSSVNKAANGFETFIYNKNPDAPTIGFQNILHPEVYQVMKAFGINNDRGKKQGNLHMLRESKMTALLSESLFISNESDAKRLKDEEFLKAVGEAHARGAAKFLGLPKKEVPVKIISFYTGGFKGDAITKVHSFLTSNNWWYQPTRSNDGSMMFLVGGFGEGTADAKKMEQFLKDNGYWYQVR